ncbi:MAG: IS982 family transposase [Nitrospinaceae bacterium]|jgi:transposase|nr:IS982 family transposase [Nitrospinaceae bacterium]
MTITPLFCEVDDFCQVFEPALNEHLLAAGEKQRQRKSTLSLSEVMTIIIWFHQSGYRTFKDYYNRDVCVRLRWAFPKLVSYNRFVELMSDALLPLCAYLKGRKGTCSGISFIDSTPIVVCHNRRIPQNRVFADVAKRGKNSMGWFYGFKLHLVVNDQGEILAFHLTPGNVDDREPVAKMAKKLFGKLFGDKGYISQELFNLLWEDGVQLVTRIRKNMKNKLMDVFDKILLRKRAIIETINDQLKNISQIEHTRHRSVINFLVNLISALIAYTHKEKKPSLNIRDGQVADLPAIVV